MPCFESEVRDKIRIDPVIAKSFFTEAKAHYEAGKDFLQTVNAMADKSGLQPLTVARVLTSDRRLSAITRDVAIKRAKYNQITRAARELVDHADTPGWHKAAGMAWNASRRAATAYHGGVFPFTHERNLLFSGRAEANIFQQTARRAYSYATPKAGLARWQIDMDKMQLRPSYKAARAAGLDITLESEPVGILSKGMKGWGRRGFDALKVSRLDLWDLYTKRIPEGMRDEVSAKLLAREINYATGALPKGQLGEFSAHAGNVMFAPKLWFARRFEAFQPLRYLAKGGRMTPGERAVSNIALRRWGKIVGVTAGILAANDAFNKYVLKNDKRVNWSDFSRPGSLWRMNVGGVIVPVSPLLEVIRTPVAFIAALFAHNKQLRGEAPLNRAAGLVLKDFLNALHPSITKGVELVTGREVYGVPGHLRRLPFPGVKQLLFGEEKEKQPAMGYGEYAASLGPIPVSAGTREFVQALKDDGANASQANAWVHALIQSALAGGVGLHTHPEAPPKKPKR